MKNIYLIFLLILFSKASVAQDFSRTVTVSAGIPVKINSGTLISASEITMKSTSTRFSSIFLEEALPESIIVNYDRYVNLIGTSGKNGGNDLISMPVKKSGSVTYSEFLTYANGTLTNADVLPQHPGIPEIYAFGPYDNVSQKYVNYHVIDDGGVILERAAGYRAARNETGSQTLRFTGNISIGDETVEMTSGSRNRWNLVGNPYPNYLDSQAFLDENSSKLDPNAVAIYGYNSGTREGEGTIGNFTIINRITYSDQKIAPGQGFLLLNKAKTASNPIVFKQDMRVFDGNDDFILGRPTAPHQMLRLMAAQDKTSFATEIYFNAHSSQGLDPGYDAALFDGVDQNFMVYSQLVKDNSGRNMAIQSLGLEDLNEINIPLGLKTAKGKKVTFSVENNTLPQDVQVFLEDKLNNTFTLLNETNYSFNAETAISGTGRFYLRLTNKTLSVDKDISRNLNVFTTDQALIVSGELMADTKISIYDIQGRLVLNSSLKMASSRNVIGTSDLSSGVYVVKLNNTEQSLTKKVIIK